MSFLSISFSILLFITSCSSDDNENKEAIQIENNTALKATIVSVASSGSNANYTFSVGISSPDTGCDQYANWWEVITEDGTLLYRRILGHSHVDEQPFVRSGGKVPIAENQVVIIRAHMNTSGYGTVIFKGSVLNGFKEANLEDSFASELATQQPLSNGCAF